MNNSQCKKEKNLSLGNSLETRSKAGEEYLQRIMPVKDAVARIKCVREPLRILTLT